MRYIVNSDGYVMAVSFGAMLNYSDCDCTEYTGNVPHGWDSLEEWHEEEGSKLWRWKIVNGNLTLDSSAVAPEEGRWGAAKLQDKSVKGLILEDMTVTPDEDYDGLSLVAIKAQPCFYMLEGDDVVILDKTVLYMQNPVQGRLPSEVFISFKGSPNVCSAGQISMAHINFEAGSAIFCLSGGNGNFGNMTNFEMWSVSVTSGGTLKIECTGTDRFFQPGSTNLYRVYLMY